MTTDRANPANEGKIRRIHGIRGSLPSPASMPDPPGTLLPIRGTFHRGDVDLDHLHHRLHGAPGAVRIRVPDQLHQPGRRHLPEDTPAVLEPAAGHLRAAIR